MKSFVKTGASFVKLILLLLAFVLAPSIFSQESEDRTSPHIIYTIDHAQYEIDGSSSEAVVRNRYPLDFGRIFESKEELEEYLEDYQVVLNSERNFQSATVTWEETLIADVESDETQKITESPETEAAPVPVTVKVSIKDSMHILALPYIKFDTNTGLALKVKAKDTNFFGTLEEFNLGLSYEGQENWYGDATLSKNLVTHMDFSLPFQIGMIQSKWMNDFDYCHNFSEAMDEFSLNSGFRFYLPWNTNGVALEVIQSVQKEWDYDKYGDSLFFTTEAELSSPILVKDMGAAEGKIILSPVLRLNWNYDMDGILPFNEDIKGPELFAGAFVEFGQVNWDGNFRYGLSGRASAEVMFNFGLEKSWPEIQLDMLYFKNFGFMGMNLRGSLFCTGNHKRSVGESLRGIKDTQYHATLTDTLGIPKKALSTETAIVLNADFPVRLFQVDWSRLIANPKLSFMSLFNFELQLSPFVDIAFLNDGTESSFYMPSRALYSAGVEAIVFPEKWRSYAVRASYGVDLGQTVFSGIVDTSWKEPCLPWELFIGLGLHF